MRLLILSIVVHARTKRAKRMERTKWMERMERIERTKWMEGGLTLYHLGRLVAVLAAVLAHVAE